MQARLLVVDAKHRLTAKQALQHPWMQVSPPPSPFEPCLLPVFPVQTMNRVLTPPFDPV